VDIWRSIADMGAPALKEMIETGVLGLSLTSPPERQCHHLVFLPPTRVQLEVDRRRSGVSLVSIFEKGARGVSLTPLHKLSIVNLSEVRNLSDFLYCRIHFFFERSNRRSVKKQGLSNQKAT
jgi:hypothetical protein